MKIKLLGGTVALLTGSLLSPGCGGDSTQSMTMQTQQPQALDTMQVLAIARSPSETTDPLPVADGALMLADANDDTSDPVPVT
jgi:hypothetical protein